MAATTVRSCSNTTTAVLKACHQQGLTYSRLKQNRLSSYQTVVLLRGDARSNSTAAFGHLKREHLYCHHNTVTWTTSTRPYTRAKVGTVVTDEESLLSLNFLFIKTCKNWWFEAPQGIEFDTGFVDSMPGAKFNERIPVVLGIPSAVGSHKDLAELLSTFAKLGYRVIIPNMPGTTLCKARTRMDDAMFQYSVEEKAQFIKDFLQELEIPKIDMLVTNGCSVYTGLYLCLHSSTQFKSLSLINPTGIRPTKSMMPNYFTVSVVHVWEEQMHIRALMLPYIWFGKWFTGNRHLGHRELVTFARSAFRISYKDIQMGARDFRARQVPTFVVYSDQCPDLDVTATEDFLTLAGVPQSAVATLDENDDIVREGEPIDKNMGLMFSGDVGDIKQSKAPTIRRYMLKFFKTVRPDV